MRGQSNSLPRIGVDLMGSDTAPETLFQGVIDLFEELRDSAQITVYATQQLIDRFSPSFLTCIPVTEVIEMRDDPLTALRRKKKASLSLGMIHLQKRKIDAFISLGNTGALIGCAKMHLPKLGFIDRPALMTLLPTKHKAVAVLDVGANVHCKAEHLVQFASMGIAYQKCRGIAEPTVGLLNIGSEEKKGTSEHREAYQKLLGFNREYRAFVGNVEGKDVFSGAIDVLVTDGFTGNIFLKTGEGVARFILDLLEEKITGKESSELKAILFELRHRVEYAEYPGAILCGVDGIVVKCHGDSPPQALAQSIKAAIRLVKHRFLDNIKAQLSQEAHRFRLSSLFGRR
jgi:phosphate acyltransferase